MNVIVKIRLKRIGTKKRPRYRVVVADSASKRDGRVIAEIGYYDPTREPAEFRVDSEVAKQWIKNGAQPSDTVKALMAKAEVAAQ